MSFREDCRCGHDIDTHHERMANCLANACECKTYRDAAQPDTPRMVTPIPSTQRTSLCKPHASSACYCDACCSWLMNRRWP